jgi:hypothetical protein
MSTALLRPLPRTLFTALLALAGTLASFAVTTTPLHAAARGAYTVTLAAPLAKPRQEILDGTMWRCTADRCGAPVDGERAVSICGKVARKFGPVAQFATPQGELSAEDLARCNAAA